MRSGTLAGCVNQYPDLDLNQDLDLRRVQCVPLVEACQVGASNGCGLDKYLAESLLQLVLDRASLLADKINTRWCEGFWWLRWWVA